MPAALLGSSPAWEKRWSCRRPTTSDLGNRPAFPIPLQSIGRLLGCRTRGKQPSGFGLLSAVRRDIERKNRSRRPTAPEPLTFNL